MAALYILGTSFDFTLAASADLIRLVARKYAVPKKFGVVLLWLEASRFWSD